MAVAANQAERMTIRELAARIGVSKSTVSLALRAPGEECPLRPETRQRVLDAARRFNFQPHRLASGLCGGRTASVGVIWPFVDPWAGDTGIGLDILGRLQRRGLATYQAQHGDLRQQLRSVIADFRDRGVDALIAYSTPEQLTDPRLRGDLEKVRAVITVSYRWVDGLPFDQVVHDRNAAIVEVVDHFAATGRRKPAFMLNTQLATNRDKYAVFRRRCEEHGLSPQLIELPTAAATLDDPTAAEAPRYLRALRAAFPTRSRVAADAVFAFNDIGAMAACRHLEDLGLRVPDDVAVVGFNNTDPAALWRPALATGDRRRREVVDAVERLFVQRTEQPDLPPQRSDVAMRFMWRESAGGPPPADEAGSASPSHRSGFPSRPSVQSDA